MKKKPILRRQRCPVCKDSRLSTARHAGRSLWRCCASCHTWIYCPSPNTLAYPAEYYGGPAAKFTGWAQALRAHFHRGRARLVRRWLRQKKGRVYDVGCGDGLFLQEAAQLGLSTVGFEPEPIPRNQAETRLGKRLDSSLFQSLRSSKAAAISCWQVIEHLADPRTFLHSCHQHLMPDGILALSTVNLGSYQARLFGKNWLHLDPPRHLWVSDLNTVVRMVESSGFRVLQIRHNSLEFGPVGWADSCFNLFDSKRDRLLHCLKLGCHEPKDWLVWGLTVILTPLSMLLSMTESLLNHPATFEIYARADKKRARRHGG